MRRPTGFMRICKPAELTPGMIAYACMVVSKYLPIIFSATDTFKFIHTFSSATSWDNPDQNMDVKGAYDTALKTILCWGSRQPDTYEAMCVRLER